GRSFARAQQYRSREAGSSGLASLLRPGGGPPHKIRRRRRAAGPTSGPGSIEPEVIASEYGVGVKTVQERVEDAMREVGTLLITFAPLDAALAEGSGIAGKFLSRSEEHTSELQSRS